MAPLPPFPWIDVLIILALVALNGVFAMSELAIVSSRKARLEAMARSGRTSVPQIFIDGTHVGGCDDLLALDRAGKLDALLAA